MQKGKRWMQGIRVVLKTAFGTDARTSLERRADTEKLLQKIEAMGDSADRLREAIGPAGSIDEALQQMSGGKRRA